MYAFYLLGKQIQRIMKTMYIGNGNNDFNGHKYYNINNNIIICNFRVTFNTFKLVFKLL